MSVVLPWGSDRITVDLPADWEVAPIASPRRAAALDDLPGRVTEALRRPTGSAALESLARSSKPGRVAVVVEDISRPTPTVPLVEGVVDRLLASGVEKSAITIAFALGIHRPMTEAEMEKKAGAKAVASLRCLNHAAFDPDRLVRVGTTRRGTPVEVLREVAEADLRVLVGTIEPHVQAGFGGGFKLVLPGVSGARSIGTNHLLSANPGRFSWIGLDPEEDPMRLDLEEAGRMLPGSSFLLDAVLNPEGRIARLVSGDPVAAHREGIRFVRSLYGVEVPWEADVVVTDSHPMDINIRQGVKGVANVLTAVREGGSVLALLRCELGADDVKIPSLPAPPLSVVRALLRALGPRGTDLLARIALKPLPIEDRFFLYIALQALRRARIFVYAPELVRAFRRPPSFLSADLPNLLTRVARLHRRPRVLVFPHGGTSYPVLPSVAAREAA